jgi:hypothetical protein
MMPGEFEAKSSCSSSLVVPKMGLHVADPPFPPRASGASAAGNGNSEPLPCSKSGLGAVPLVDPGPAPTLAPEPEPLACFSRPRPMRRMAEDR